VDGSSDTSIASIIGTGTAGITKTGTGTLTLSGANTYTGAVAVNAGRLKIGNAQALGLGITSTTATTVASGATLDLNGQTVSNLNLLYMSGTGAASAGGALINSNSNAASIAGQITLNGATTINALSGDITLGSSSNINGKTNVLTVDGAYNTTIYGGINSSTNAAGTGGYTTFIKKGTGTLTLSGNNGASTNAAGAGLTALTIEAGSVKLGHTNALGSNGNNPFGLTWSGYGVSAIINSGATLDINGLQYGKTPAIVLSGTGAAGAGGAIVNTSTSAAAKMQGIYLLADDATIASNGAGLNIDANSSNVKFFNIRNKTLTLTGTGTTGNDVITTAIIGTGNLRKTGTGSWMLNPGNSGSSAAGYLYIDYNSDTQTYSTVAAPTVATSNFFSGNVYVDAGTLKLGKDTAFGSTSAGGTSVASAAVASGATLDLFGRTVAVNTTLSLSGTGAAGAGGALVNTSTTSSAYYTGSVTLTNDTTINASGSNITLYGSISGSDKTLTVDGGYSTTLASVVGTGSGGIIKNGTGALTLQGANTFTGNVAVNAGRLQLGNANALGTSSTPTVTVASGATFDVNGQTVTNTNTANISGTGASGYTGAIINSSTTAASFAGNIVLNADSTIAPSSGILTLSGVISGNYQLTLGGTSSSKYVSLTGASANTFGSLNLAGYDLVFSNANQLGSGTITSSSANARLIYGPSGSPAATSTTINLSNELNTGADNTKVLAIAPNDATNVINLNGKITGSGKLKVSGSGVLVLNSTTNDFTGGIEVGTGTIQVADSGALGSGTINFGTTTASVLSFTDTASVANSLTMSASSYTANIDVSSGKTATLSGVISPATSGGKLTKTGNGSLVLSNTNTYSGATTVSAGTLTLSGSGSIASSAVTVANAATLKATNASMPASAVTGAITLNSGAIIDLTAGSLKATSLTVGALSGSDVTKISYTIGNSFALTGALTLTGNLALDLTSTLTGAGVYDVLTWTGAPTGIGSISFIDHSTADWTMTGLQTDGKYTIKVAASFVDGGNLSSGTVSVPSGSTVGAVSGTTTVSAAATTTVGAISGGTVNLSGANNTVGAVSGGTVNLNAAGSTVASLATGGALNVKADSTVTSLTGGTLSVDSGVNATVTTGTSTAKITGAGNLLKTGNGTLTLSGTTSDYTGATKVQAGTVQVTDVAALGSTSGVTLGTVGGANDAKLQIAATGSTILSTNISATNTTSANIVENSGSGALTLSGSLTKNGTVLTLAGGSSGINVTGNIIGSAANSDLVVSSGTVKVTSSNSYNGPTFIQAGATLIADNASATGTGIVNVANGATLQVGTSTNHALTLSTGGFALTNGAIIRVYVGSVNINGLTANSGSNIDTRYTHYDLTNSAGVTYSSLATSGALDVTDVTAGGITIQVYSTGATTSGFETNPFYDFKFLEAANVTGLGSGLNIADLFTINTSNLRYANGNTVTGVSGWGNYSDLIKVYTVNNGGNTVLMMSIPEPSTYGLGLGALALAAVAIRRRKQKKATV
jgi:autotransporter-associated beta strand protein